MLRYLGFTTLCDIAFGVFVIAWFITRHIFYPLVVYSVWVHTLQDIAPGCYGFDSSSNTSFEPMSDDPNGVYAMLGGDQIWSNLVTSYTDRLGPVCWHPTMRYWFLSLLLALQVIVFFWFVMIIKVVYKVLSGQNADDDRSDDEGEEDEVDEIESGKMNGHANSKTNMSHPINALAGCHGGAPLQKEVGAGEINLARKSYKKPSERRGSSRTSGISIPGHGDRKELLGRIGCDKPT